MKKATALIAVILIMCSLLCACNEGSSESLFGKWAYSADGAKMTYTFNSDGTGNISAMGGFVSATFAYQLKDGTITFREIGDSIMGDTPYNYSIKGDKLTLTCGSETLVLTKEK